jgi:hypothetical protein
MGFGDDSRLPEVLEKFHLQSLCQQTLAIDLDEHQIVQSEKILGILQAMVRDTVPERSPEA